MDLNKKKLIKKKLGSILGILKVYLKSVDNNILTTRA